MRAYNYMIPHFDSLLHNINIRYSNTQQDNVCPTIGLICLSETDASTTSLLCATVFPTKTLYSGAFMIIMYYPLLTDPWIVLQVAW